MTDAIRTPDQILEGLPDFPYTPHYRTVEVTVSGASPESARTWAPM